MTYAIKIMIHQLKNVKLAELNMLVPMDRCEKVDRQLVRSIIGLTHRMGLGIHWSNQLANELHKSVRSFPDRTRVTNIP